MQPVLRVPSGRGPARLLAGCVFVVVLTSVFGAAGCSLLMDLNTDGYHAAGQSAAGDAACSSDGTCVALGCAGAADCQSGQICCGTATTSSIALACEKGPSCSGAASVQLCTSSTECTGTPCVPQECSLGGVTGSFRACSLIASFCTPVGGD